jgi:hypothetical protein
MPLNPKLETGAVLGWMAAITKAALAFEARWTLAALKRVDRDIHARLREQRNLFDQVTVTGPLHEVELHAAALVRGWQKAIRVMETADAPDDAYLVGEADGFKVAIGHQKAAAKGALERGAVWITPDEVAAILANVEAFKSITAIKRLFPGAEASIRRDAQRS